MARQSKREVFAKGAASVSGEAGKEKVVLTLAGVTTEQQDQSVRLEGTCPLESEAECEQCTVRLRRGGVAGALIAEVKVAMVGATKAVVPIEGFDEPGEVAGQEYVMTIEEKKATKIDKALVPTLCATF